MTSKAVQKHRNLNKSTARVVGFTIQFITGKTKATQYPHKQPFRKEQGK